MQGMYAGAWSRVWIDEGYSEVLSESQWKS